ncbi:LiaF transmembrane domain-containing protein [Pseudogracilibacillus sp. SO30301A]|uniref:LiaF transmembrane domain-containing protein n=1 Tax=Pseudogracilibacillus sp. SO30301A TaxID=3098291 RepID=UPI00300E27E1
MSGRVWFGLFFLVIGVGFFMHQANLLDFTAVLSTWWPLILIVIGIIQLVNRTYSSPLTGVLFIIVGGLFLANHWFEMNLAAFIWPLVIIFIGLAIIFTRGERGKKEHMEQDLKNFLLFSGTELRSQSKDFRGGNVTAIFGEAEIDLREAEISDEGATLDITAVFGGVTIIVPENVHVKVTGNPIFGGWEDKRRHLGDEESLSVLKLNCLAVFGGVVIKN